MIDPLGKIESLGSTVRCWNQPGTYSFNFTHDADYFKSPEQVEIEGWLEVTADNRRILLLHSPRPSEGKKSEEEAEIHSKTFYEIAALLEREPIDLNAPLPLSTVAIPKPWGEEIWYTGIEARGVSMVNNVPLPWLIDLLGPEIGLTNNPLLLKILAPHREENLGDLYFEMHEQKVEVYIVTHVDPEAWPNGIGKIRYGFSQALKSRYSTQEEFLQAYLGTVTEYQSLRGRIDQQLSGLKSVDGVNDTEVITPQQHAAYLSKIDAHLLMEEESQRRSMYEFTELRDIRVGDVITVEPLTPHSLQHGVRVVEFQTPHYERYILSFGQKVLTQNHWDTEVVLEKLRENSTDPVNAHDGTVIANFDAFRVERIELQPGNEFELLRDDYTLVMGIIGTVNARTNGSSFQIEPEQARLVQANQKLILHNEEERQCALLVACEN